MQVVDSRGPLRWQVEMDWPRQMDVALSARQWLSGSLASRVSASSLWSLFHRAASQASGWSLLFHRAALPAGLESASLFEETLRFRMVAVVTGSPVFVEEALPV
jgi:hypothetical protein